MGRVIVSCLLTIIRSVMNTTSPRHCLLHGRQYLCNNNFGEPIFIFSFTEHQLYVQRFHTQWAKKSSNIWMEHVSVRHKTSGTWSISSDEMFFRDLVSWCCGWSFLWWFYSWSYLLHRHHIDPPACLKQSVHHNLHAAMGESKQGEEHFCLKIRLSVLVQLFLTFTW